MGKRIHEPAASAAGFILESTPSGLRFGGRRDPGADRIGVTVTAWCDSGHSAGLPLFSTVSYAKLDV